MNVNFITAVVFIFRRSDFMIESRMDIPGLFSVLQTYSSCYQHLEDQPNSNVLSNLADK